MISFHSWCQWFRGRSFNSIRDKSVPDVSPSSGWSFSDWSVSSSVGFWSSDSSGGVDLQTSGSFRADLRTVAESGCLIEGLFYGHVSLDVGGFNPSWHLIGVCAGFWSTNPGLYKWWDAAGGFPWENTGSVLMEVWSLEERLASWRE